MTLATMLERMMADKHMLILVATALLLAHQFSGVASSKSKKDINRKSIVFDIKTPKVFYCQQEKQSDYSKMIVKAKPLEKLCEYDGNLKPKNTPSDCYNDVDESEYACDEKKRFMLRLDRSADLTTNSNDQGNAFELEDLDYVLSMGVDKKKGSGSGTDKKSKNLNL